MLNESKMAAAPDLLAALERVVEWLDATGHQEDQSWGARAAVAKAKGE